MKTIFAKSFTSTAPIWYPYASMSTSTNTSTSSTGTASKSNSGVPAYVWPLVGAIIGLVILVAAGCAIFLYMKKKKAFNSTQSQTGYMATSETKPKPSRLHSWLRQVSPDAGSGIHTEDGYFSPPSSAHPNMSSVSAMTPYAMSPQPTSPRHGTSLSGSSYMLPHIGIERHELPGK